MGLVEVSGARRGSYELIGEEGNGEVLHLRRETPAAASLRRLGAVPATQAEFEAEYGPIAPADASARRMGLVPATLEEVEAEFGPMLPPDDEG